MLIEISLYSKVVRDWSYNKVYSFSFNLPVVFNPNRLERHLLSAKEVFYAHLSLLGNFPSL